MKKPILLFRMRGIPCLLTALILSSFAGANSLVAAVAISEQSGAPSPGTYVFPN